MLDILVILDRSGSMQHAKSDHEGGLKSFVEDQKSLAGDVRFTFVRFDSYDPCEIVYDRVPLDHVTDIQLVPRGGTPLLDAMGKALAHLEGRQILNQSERTVCMVITDGQENESREWSKAQVAARVKDLEAKSWVFLFLGANIDSFSEAGSVGVSAMMAMDFSNDAQGVKAAYAATSSNLRGARCTATESDFRSSMNYTDDQRASAKGKA